MYVWGLPLAYYSTRTVLKGSFMKYESLDLFGNRLNQLFRNRDKRQKITAAGLLSLAIFNQTNKQDFIEYSNMNPSHWMNKDTLMDYYMRNNQLVKSANDCIVRRTGRNTRVYAYFNLMSYGKSDSVLEISIALNGYFVDVVRVGCGDGYAIEWIKAVKKARAEIVRLSEKDYPESGVAIKSLYKSILDILDASTSTCIDEFIPFVSS